MTRPAMPNTGKQPARRRWAPWLLVLLLMPLALTRCGSLEDLVEVPDTPYGELWSELFNRCGACHGVSSAGTEGGPDLTTLDATHRNLVGKRGNDYPDWDTFFNNRPDCETIPFIAPGNPNNSLVVAILDDTVADGLAPCVPSDHTGPPMRISASAETMSKLRDWISDGAPRN